MRARTQLVGVPNEREAIEVLFGLWELARSVGTPRPGPTAWAEAPAHALARITGLTAAQVSPAIRALVANHLVSEQSDDDTTLRYRLAAEVLYDLPVLAQLSAPRVASTLEGSVPPALALLRCIAYEIDSRKAPAVQTTLRELSATTLYGVSTLQKALPRLERAGLIRRTQEWHAMWIELLPAALGEMEAPALRPASDTPRPSAAAPKATGARIEVGGVRFRMEPGSEVHIDPGADVRVETSPEGETSLWIGQIRITPE